jgi:AcrR family transcriptional regulator
MAPKSASQFEEVRKESRDKILNAALKLFANESYHATSISKIAKEAGVSKGLMYNYFNSKEDLLNAILADAMKQGEVLAAEMMKAETPQDQIKYLIEMSYDWIVNHEEYSKTLMSLSLELGKFPQIQKMVEGKIEGMKQFYVHLFKQLGFEKPEMEAKVFGALMDGIGLQYVSIGDKMGMDEIKQFLIDKYCNNTKTPTK